MSDQVGNSDQIFWDNGGDPKAKQRFRTLVKAIDDGITFVDADGEVIFANKRAEEILGRPSEELGDLSHDDVCGDLVDEDGERIEAEENLFARLLARKEPIYDQTVGLRHPSDGRIWLSVSGAPEWNENGEFVGAVFVIEDITERREVESELEEIFGRITDAFYALDDQWQFTHVNTRAEELIDYTGEGLVGKNIWDVFEWGANSKLRKKYEQAMETQEARSFELYYPDPLDAWYEINAYPSETGLSVYFRDVTRRKEREKELELFRTLLNHSTDSVLVIDPETGRYLDVNDTACRRRGYSRQELLERSVPDIETEIPDRQAWQSFVADLKEAGQLTFDGYHRRKDGTTYPVEVNSTYVKLDRGYVLAIARDVTDRREQERHLKESEHRYRTLVENFPNGAVGLFDKDLRYQIAGGDMLEDVGTSAEEIVGKTVWERYPEDVAETMATKFRAALDGEATSFELEFHDRYWNAHTVPVEDDAGEIFAGMVMVQDVTEQKEIERELRESEAKFRMVAENVDEIVWMTTPDAEEFLYVNPTYEDIWGLDRDELYEDPTAFAAVLHPDDRDRVLEAWEVLPEEEYEEEFRIIRPDGELRWIHAQASRVHDESGDVTRIVGIANDVTERKEREQALEESNERLEQFAYAASHDLQEPLRMISSYLQLLERRYEDELDEDGQEFVEFAVDGAERMRAMIDGLLEYSRVDTKGEPLEPIELENVLEDALENLRVKIEENDAEITAESLPRVQGDESQLQQVFQNLLSNAIEYSGDEPPRIHITADRSGQQWEISVHDEGIGIDPDSRERIFDVFQRLHSREEHAGTGIGLALCQRIVERHGGTIWVDSEPGEGATFSFTLPPVAPSEM